MAKRMLYIGKQPPDPWHIKPWPNLLKAERNHQPESTHTMSNAQHTPGPWSTAPTQSDHGKTTCIQDASGLIIAKIPWPSESIDEANARLMAAAPEMYEACKAAVAYDDACEECGDDPYDRITYRNPEGKSIDLLRNEWINATRDILARIDTP